MPDIDIKHLNRDEIDCERWNETIRKSVNSRIYGFTWYLDAITLKSWSGLVIGEYDAVFPILSKKKLFIPYVTNPYLCQQLGLFSTKPIDENGYLEYIFKYLRTRFLKSDLLVFNNISSNRGALKKTNHILKLNKNYSDLFDQFNRNTQRNIKKGAENRCELLEFYDIQLFVNFLIDNDKSGVLRSIRNNIVCLIESSFKRGNGKILIAKNNDGILAVSYYIEDNSRIYFLLCASSPMGTEKRAMYLIIDSLVHKYSGSNKVFDFTGSSMKNIARRNEGFGAETEYYFHVKLNWNLF
jgi:hypothetical protein